MKIVKKFISDVKSMRGIDIILCIAIAILILPTMYTILFSWPIADDFAMIVDASKGTALWDAIRIASEYYMNHTGGWIWIFGEVFFNPLLYAPIDSYLLGIELVIFFCFFLLTMWIFVDVLFHDVFQKDNITLRLFTFFAFFVCLLNTEVYKEIFYWFIGSVYMMNVISVVWTWILEIKFFKNPCKKNAILLIIVGMISCSSWMVAVYPCLVFLCYILADFFYTKKKRIRTYLPLVFMVLSALVALFAPGNFVRHSQVDSTGFHFVEAFNNTTYPFKLGLIYLFKNPFFIILLVVFFIYGYQLLDRFAFAFKVGIIPIVVTIGLLFFQYYIVVLGDGSAEIPNRMAFLFNFFAMAMFSVCASYIGAWVRRKTKQALGKNELMILVMVGLLFLQTNIFINNRYETLPWKYTVESIDIIKVNRSRYKKFYKAIEECPDEDAVIYFESIPETILKKVGINRDPEYWVNESVADYFGKKSLVVYWTDFGG